MPALFAIVVGQPLEPVELRPGQDPFLEIEPAQLPVAADHVAAERRFGPGDRARKRAREDHHVIAVRLQSQRAVALTVRAAQRGDEPDQNGGAQQRHHDERDGPPGRTAPKGCRVGLVLRHAATIACVLLPTQ
jgi:hypothetical protein